MTALNMLVEKLMEHPDRVLSFYSVGGQLETASFRTLYGDIQSLLLELEECGLTAGCRVGLVGSNRYEYVVTDLALLKMECVSVCFPASLLEEESLESLAEKYQLDALLAVSAKDVVARGGEFSSPWIGILDRRPIRLHRRYATGTRSNLPCDVFSLAFSSGTTGRNKCLMMSAAGIRNTIEMSGRLWQVRHSDVILIVLPFSNLQQRTMVYLAIWFGFDVAIATPERMFKAIKQMAPSIFIGPPSFFETFETQTRSRSGWWRAGAAFLDIVLSPLMPSFLLRALRKSLYRELHGQLSPRARLLLVGSAPSRLSTLKLFRRAGLPLHEVYGVTEFGWISFNLPGSDRLGSIGKVVPGVRLEIADGREIIVGADYPQTLGYFGSEEEETRAVYLPEGRVATGDIGYLDDDGYLHLRGRKKNLIITRSGYKIHPELLESRLERLSGVSRAMVIDSGDSNRLSCILWLKDWQMESVQAQIREAIDSLNASLPAPERISGMVFADVSELTTESGMLTRNFKVNRSVVLNRYKSALPGVCYEFS